MNILLTVLSPLLFLFTVIDFLIFTFTGKNSDFSYRIFRKSFISTAGRINSFLSFLVSIYNPKLKKSELNTLVGTKTHLIDEIEEFKVSMNQNGYYQFNNKMNSEDLNNLKTSLSLMPLNYNDLYSNENLYIKNNNYSVNANKFNRSKHDLVNSKAVRDWALSKDFVILAQEYLGSAPICDLMASWISLPTSNDEMMSKSAQKFHFDMDRIKFIKFFVYLSDVSIKNGPHCYIKSSHKGLPFNLRRDGRFEDNEIITAYGIENYKEFTGPSGTVIAVDTRGFHKGVPLIEGKRDILQVEYSNSIYGHNYPKSEIFNQDLNTCQLKILRNF